MERMAKEQLNKQTEKMYGMRTKEPTLADKKIVIEDADDEQAMKQKLMQMNKEKLFVATDIFGKTAEPQIKPSHKGEFDLLMQSIGILNTAMVNDLWSNIEETV